VVIVTTALAAAACSSGGSDSPTVSGGGPTTTSGVPVFAPGSTMAALQAKGKVTVGVKFDQPGFGQRNPTTGDIEGFDVEIAKGIVAGIFGGTPAAAASKINFVEAVSANREPYIQNGTVDMVIATYTINDARKQVVDFAGPYFIAHQDIMVKASDNSIKSVTDLNGKKVCTANGSTSLTNLKAKAPQADLSLLFDKYSDCAQALTDGRVQAVSTDAPILGGLVATSNGAYKLVNAPFTDEPYGIGVKKGDTAFRSFVNDQLEKMYTNGQWAAAFSSTLGKLALMTPTPPAVDRYTTTPSTVAATTTTTK
jgi:glutamate transport system substrate-binding protein